MPLGGLRDVEIESVTLRRRPQRRHACYSSSLMSAIAGLQQSPKSKWPQSGKPSASPNMIRDMG
jgi:hypothetical protein